MVSARQLYRALARVLGRPGLASPQDDRPPPTWVHRIQQEENLWLRAVALEHQGRLLEAWTLYMRDADQQAARGLHLHAALACVAAAEAASRRSDAARSRQALERAGAHFRLHAERAAQWSLREAGWAYERAACVYDALGLTRAAAEMRRFSEQALQHLMPPLDGVTDVGESGVR